MASLPSDIIREILLKSPVKSLIRFKSLNKSLCNLIESPNFVHTHHLMGSSSSLVFVNNPRQFSVLKEKLITWRPGIEVQPSIREISLAEFNNNPILYFFCCSDGVFCFRIRCCFYNCPNCGKFLLWNPALRSSLTIPAYEGKEAVGALDYTSAFGMGVVGQDSIKLIRIYKARARVFDAPSSSWRRTELGSWREIEKPQIGGVLGSEPVRLNTTLHWPATAINSRQIILSFDLVTEVFTQISLPPCIVCPEVTAMVPLAFKGKLGFISGRFHRYNSSDSSYDPEYFTTKEFYLWVRKKIKYGDSMSWILLYRITNIPGIHRPLRSWNDDQIIVILEPHIRRDCHVALYDTRNVGMYDPKKARVIDPRRGVTRVIDLSSTNMRMRLKLIEVSEYKESLIGA